MKYLIAKCIKCYEKGNTIGGMAMRKLSNLTDAGNAYWFAERNRGKLIYVKAWGWLVCDGKRWKSDEKDEVMIRAKETSRAIYEEADITSNEDYQGRLRKWADNSLNRSRLNAMISLAESELAGVPDEFDKDKMLINCQNGVLDLKTGKFTLRDI